MRKFEYTVLDVPTKGFWGGKIDYEALTKHLNEMGSKGWEVTAMNDSNMHQGGTRAIVIILKREITH